MTQENPEETGIQPADDSPWHDLQPPEPPATPIWWRCAIAAAVFLLVLLIYLMQGALNPRLQSALGAICIIGFIALLSRNLRAVNWRTIGWGIALQVLLALFVLKFEVGGGFMPGRELFQTVGEAIQAFLQSAYAGTKVLFGSLAETPGTTLVVLQIVSPIIFVSAVFTILYYFGALQFIVSLMARAMMYCLRTSGAESLSAAANVFMGQTEAPLIVRPYVERMTQSELFALMVGGLATISGGIMAVYIGFGANPVYLLTTSVMAAPCSLYLAKLLIPETQTPETLGSATVSVEQKHRNVLDAAAGGTIDGFYLALNVVAMLLSFLALIALVNSMLDAVPTGHSLYQFVITSTRWNLVGNLMILGICFFVVYSLLRLSLRQITPQLARSVEHRVRSIPAYARGFGVALLFVLFLVAAEFLVAALPENMTLTHIFSWLFSPLALLMGIQGEDVRRVADLLGTKLVATELVAYQELLKGPYRDLMSPRAQALTMYALTGFANFVSVGILVGGIGHIAPNRRSDLARLGLSALLVGFLVTCVNAAVAGTMLAPTQTTGAAEVAAPLFAQP